MIKHSLLLFFMWGHILLASAQTHCSDVETFMQLFKKERIVFVQLNASACKECKTMEQVLSDSLLQPLLTHHFEWVQVDAQTPLGQYLQSKYTIQQFPNYLFLEHPTRRVHQLAGRYTASAFARGSLDALNPFVRLEALELRFQQGTRDSIFMAQYLRARQAAGLFSGEILNDYMSGLPRASWASFTHWRWIKTHLKQIHVPLLDTLLKYPHCFEPIASKAEVLHQVKRIYQAHIKHAFRQGYVHKRALRTLQKQVENAQFAYTEEVVLLTELHFLAQKKRWKRYSRLANRLFLQDSYTDYQVLNNAAWTFYEEVQDPKLLQAAIAWVKRSIELKDRAFNNDTCAVLYQKAGQRKLALHYAQRALERAQSYGLDLAHYRQRITQIALAR